MLYTVCVCIAIYCYIFTNLEKWTVKQLLPSPHNGVLILVLSLQSLWEALHESSQRTACKTLEE